jgi:hypothetical protein
MTEWMVLLYTPNTNTKTADLSDFFRGSVLKTQHYDSWVASKIIAQNLFIVDAETIDKGSSVSPLLIQSNSWLLSLFLLNRTTVSSSSS